MPGNFSWIEEGVIAASQIPHEDSHFNFLKEQGIKVIINLTTNPTSLKYADSFDLVHIPVEDFAIPTKEDVFQFWKVVQEAEQTGKPVLVHCFAGCGRTGVFLAIWLLLSNRCSEPQEAVRKIRELRPCSIETSEQQQFVSKFYQEYRVAQMRA